VPYCNPRSNPKKTEKIPINASDIADGSTGIAPEKSWKTVRR